MLFRPVGSQDSAMLKSDGKSDAEIMRPKIVWALNEGGASPAELVRRAKLRHGSAVSEWKRTGRIAKKHLPLLAEVTGTLESWWLKPDVPVPPTPEWRIGGTAGSRSEPHLVRAPYAAPTSGFPQRLKILLTETKVTPSSLSRELKLSQATVKRWLDGAAEPTAGQIFQIADAHQYSARWLATGTWEVTGKGGVPLRMQLNEEEFRVLQMYRQLPPESREKADIYVKGLVDAMPLPKNVVRFNRPDGGDEPRR